MASVKNITTLAALVSVFYLTSFSSAVTFDPYVRGPNTVVKAFYNLTTTNLTKHVTVWAPKEAGNYPVLFLSGSLAGNVPGETSMTTVINHVVSWGFVIINPWKIYSSPIDNYHYNYIDPTLEYLEEVLIDDLIAAGASPDLSIDGSRMILIGHSAGNHVNVNYLKEQCGNFVASILMSPVDGADPFGIIQDYCIVPGELLNFNMPTLTMQAGLDPVKGSALYPACAPERLSNMRFYNAMPGDRWFLNATAFGHVDFFEDDFVGAVDFLNFCGTDSTTDKLPYKRFIAGTIVAFSKAMLEPETYCDMLQYVEDTSLMPVENGAESDVTGRCQPAACTWVPGNSSSTPAF